MANAGVRGRPIAPLVLSGQERAYLERQVRRHRVARSLSERCRVILRCADGEARFRFCFFAPVGSKNENWRKYGEFSIPGVASPSDGGYDFF